MSIGDSAINHFSKNALDNTKRFMYDDKRFSAISKLKHYDKYEGVC